MWSEIVQQAAMAVLRCVIDKPPSRISRQNMANGSLRGSMRRSWLQNLALILLISARRVNEERGLQLERREPNLSRRMRMLPHLLFPTLTKLVFQKTPMQTIVSHLL